MMIHRWNLLLLYFQTYHILFLGSDDWLQFLPLVWFWLVVYSTYPSERYKSLLGSLFPIYGKMTMFQTTNQNLLMSSIILYVTCVTYHQNVELAWQIWEPRICRPSHDEGGAFFNVGKQWQTHVTCLIIDGWGKSKHSKTVRSHFAYGYESKPWYPGDPK